MRQAVARLILFGSAALLLMSACGGGGSEGGNNGGGNPQPANISPTANAGGAQTVAAGTSVTLNGLGSTDTDGTIVGFAWTQTEGMAVTLLNANTSQASFVAPSVSTDAGLTFRLIVTDDDGAVSVAATVRINVIAPAPSLVTIAGILRYARPQFLNVSPFGLDYANVDTRPVRGVIVRAIDASTQAVLGTSSTDATGEYSFRVQANTTMAIQVVARLQRDTALPRWDVRVQDGVPGTNPYTFTSASLNSNMGRLDVLIPSGFSSTGVATGARASGPFAILDTIYTAIQAVTATGVAPTADFPALIVNWGSQTAGTFFSTNGGQHIALMADLTEDTDEFDQHVVAHEFGHYIERNFSRSDSIGGPHTIGDLLDPRVAFGEGFGYAFSAIVLNDPLVRDTFVDENGVSKAGGFSVEVNPPNLSIAGPGCWCSETSVWSILWDLYDSASDGRDGIALGFAPIWEVLTSTTLNPSHRNTPAVTSIFSFITALKAAQPGQVAAIDNLVSSQNINSSSINAFATSESNHPPGLPFFTLPMFPDISLGSTLVVRSTGTALRRNNKLGNHRFLRFTPATSGSVTVSLGTSNAALDRDPDFYVYRSGIPVAGGTNDSTEIPERETFSVIGGSTYIIDVYDCANGCSTDQGTPGDYDLTVTIN